MPRDETMRPPSGHMWVENNFVKLQVKVQGLSVDLQVTITVLMITRNLVQRKVTLANPSLNKVSNERVHLEMTISQKFENI